MDRPFDPAVLDEAEQIASQYRIILAYEDGEYYGSAVEMPLVFGEGRTANTCVKDTREALTAAVATMLEEGQEPPQPASENRRTEQVNIRLTAMEKLHLEDAARRQGFRGLSDYMRRKALEGV